MGQVGRFPSSSTIEDRVKTNVDAIMRYQGLSQLEVGRRIGMKRSSVQAKIRRTTKFTIDELVEVAHALDVPITLLLAEPHAALRWIIDRDEKRAG